MTIVVDASVLVAALVDAGKPGSWAEQIIGSDHLVAPEFVLIETLNVLRRLEMGSDISRLEATAAQRDASRLRAELLPFAPFADRAWQLRHSLTSYDAAYVAVAEAFDSPLATLDLRLSRSSEARCQFLTPG